MSWRFLLVVVVVVVVVVGETFAGVSEHWSLGGTKQKNFIGAQWPIEGWDQAGRKLDYHLGTIRCPIISSVPATTFAGFRILNHSCVTATNLVVFMAVPGHQVGTAQLRCIVSLLLSLRENNLYPRISRMDHFDLWFFESGTNTKPFQASLPVFWLGWGGNYISICGSFLKMAKLASQNFE